MSFAVLTHILRRPCAPKDFTRGILTGNPSLLTQGETPGFPGKWQLLHPSAWLIKPLHLDAQCWPTEPATELAHRGHDS